MARAQPLQGKYSLHKQLKTALEAKCKIKSHNTLCDGSFQGRRQPRAQGWNRGWVEETSQGQLDMTLRARLDCTCQAKH